MIFSFFRTPRHNRFHYQPLYYDERKEERERRNKEILREMGVQDASEQDGVYRPNIKGQMRRKMQRPNEAISKQRRMSNIRLVVIFLFLSAAFYFLLFS